MAANRWRIAGWVVAAVAACAALSLREVVAFTIERQFDPRLPPSSMLQWAAWSISFYLMWAALAPGIFALSRRVPFRKGRWLGPLAFHLVTSVILSACAPVALGYAFGAVLRGFDLSTLPPLLTPYWTRFALFSMVADTSIYWVILGAGFGLDAYDATRSRLRQAAELERTLVAAQVEALKMKLQPHFLFNTLNSISFLAVEKDRDGVVRMVERLSALLRSSLQSGGRQLVTVDEEVALLDQYLAIEEVRFADRLRVVRRIPPSVTQASIPSLVLQPIIENSIKHGFSRRIDAGRLEIALARDQDSLVVTVEDDGPGVPPGWDLATHCGRGLKNVIERLEKLYPGAWSFTLKNRARGGAIARLRIPWQVAATDGRTTSAFPSALPRAPRSFLHLHSGR
jgi:two-component system, LytTR family, sensor kinase